MNSPQAVVKDRKLFVTTDYGPFEFPLPDPANYPEGDILPIPFVGYFIRLRRAVSEWELADIIPQIVS